MFGRSLYQAPLEMQKIRKKVSFEITVTSHEVDFFSVSLYVVYVFIRFSASQYDSLTSDH